MLFMPDDATNKVMRVLQLVDRTWSRLGQSSTSGSTLFAGSAACSQLSTLRKLTSLVAGERATYHLQAMLPALRALKRLKCIVTWFHTHGFGALPILGKLTALEDLHMEGRLVEDYQLAFPPSLKVTTSTRLCKNAGARQLCQACTQVHAADNCGCAVKGV